MLNPCDLCYIRHALSATRITIESRFTPSEVETRNSREEEARPSHETGTGSRSNNRLNVHPACPLFEARLRFLDSRISKTLEKRNREIGGRNGSGDGGGRLRVKSIALKFLFFSPLYIDQKSRISMHLIEQNSNDGSLQSRNVPFSARL